MLANLPARGAGEVVLDAKFAGDLKGREMLKGPVPKRLGLKRGAALENHVCATRLAPTFVRYPADSDLANVGVLRKDFFHLCGIDVFPARDDHVPGAAREHEESLVVETPKIGCPQPAVAQDFGGGGRAIPVPEHRDRTPHDDLADFAGCPRSPFFRGAIDGLPVDDPHVRMRHGPTDAPGRSYRVFGTKIFITGGDQDLTENIVHLVLARLPDATLTFAAERAGPIVTAPRHPGVVSSACPNSN